MSYIPEELKPYAHYFISEEELALAELLAMKKALPKEELPGNMNRVVPLEGTIEILKSYGDEFTIIPCDCSCKQEGPLRYSENVCICLEHGLNSHEDRGLGEKVSLDEAIALLKRAEEYGLVHCPESENICNCDMRYCYPARASMEMGTDNYWPETAYIVSYDADMCVGCGVCIYRCQFNVFEMGDGTVNADTSKCWGCGVCTSTCPSGALTVGKR